MKDDDELALVRLPDGALYLVRGSTDTRPGPHTQPGQDGPHVPDRAATAVGRSTRLTTPGSRGSSRWAIGSLRYFAAWVVTGLTGLPLLALVVALTRNHGTAVFDDRSLVWPTMLFTTLGALVGALVAVVIEAVVRRHRRHGHER